jgi:cell division protein ZapA (FtsZ GTPase activity inhibitor)
MEEIMKQKYTLSIADMQINVVTEASRESVDKIVGMLDRKMREIILTSKKCPKNEAALLCALDYCSERIKSQRKLKALEAKLAMTEATLEEVLAENEELKNGN